MALGPRAHPLREKIVNTIKLTEAVNREYTSLIFEACRLVDAIHDGDATDKTADKLAKVRARREAIAAAVSAKYPKHVPLGWQ